MQEEPRVPPHPHAAAVPSSASSPCLIPLSTSSPSSYASSSDHSCRSQHEAAPLIDNRPSACPPPSSSEYWSTEEERMLMQRVEEAAEVAAMNAIGAETSTGRRRSPATVQQFAIDMADVDVLPTASREEETSDEEESGDDEEEPLHRNNENNVETAPEVLRREYTRIRLALQQNRNAQTVAYMFSAFLPFALLFFVKWCYEKRAALCTTVLGYCVFMFSDKHVVHAASNKRGTVFLACMLTMANYSMLYYIFGFDFSIFMDGLTAQFREYEPCLTTLYNVIMVDLAAKHITVIIKAVIASLPVRAIVLKRRRRLFQFIEYGSQLWRCAIPAPGWIVYFLGPMLTVSTAATEGVEPSADLSSSLTQHKTPLVDLLLVVLYICLKFKESTEYFRLLYRSFFSLLNLVSYGVAPTQEEIANEPKCSICFDNMRCPIKLSCNHIFCEECAEKWLDEKHTCPMCRATIEEQDSSFFNASTCKTVRLY